MLDGSAGQTRPVDRVVAVDTGEQATTASPCVRDAFGRPDPTGSSSRSCPARRAIPRPSRRGLELAPADRPDDEWVWLLHDDSNPAPTRSPSCSPAAEAHPTPTSSAPSCASGPRCAASSRSASPSPAPAAARPGSSAVSTTRASTTRCARCSPSTPPACWCAAACSSRSAASTRSCRSSATTSTSAGAPRSAGHRTFVVPQAVVFHAEAAHRGVRRTPLTGRHTHYQERRAALLTLLANVSGRSFAVARASGSSSARCSGCSASCWSARSGRPSTSSPPCSPCTAGPARCWPRAASARAAASGEPADVRHLLAPAWLPYRHGLDFVSDLASAADQPGRRRRRAAPGRRAAGAAAAAAHEQRRGSRRHRRRTTRRPTSPTAGSWRASSPTRSRSCSCCSWCSRCSAAREAFGSIVRRRALAGAGRGRRLVAAARRHVAARWAPAPTCRPRPTSCRSPSPPRCCSATPAPSSPPLMLLAVPFAAWGAWRLLGGRPPRRPARAAALAGRVGRARPTPWSRCVGRLGRGPLRHRRRRGAAALARPRRARLRRPRPRPSLAGRLAHRPAARPRRGLRARALALRAARHRGRARSAPPSSRRGCCASATAGVRRSSPWPPPRCCWRRGGAAAHHRVGVGPAARGRAGSPSTRSPSAAC